MMRLAVVLIGCVALSVAQFPFLPSPYQTLPAGWPAVAPATQAPPAVPTVQPAHHRNPAAEQQLANTVIAHEQNDRALQQQQLQQLAAITGQAPGAAPTTQYVATYPAYPAYPGFPGVPAYPQYQQYLG